LKLPPPAHFRPTLQKVVGFANVQPAFAAVGTRMQVDTGRSVLEAVVVKPLFYQADQP
jgi:glycine cleavage system aminomethyltransferase T